MKKFEVGKKYWTNCDGWREDYFLCVKRTDNTATFEIHGKQYRRKVSKGLWGEIEIVKVKINGGEYNVVSRTKKEIEAMRERDARQFAEDEKDFERRRKNGTLPPMCVFTGI